MLRNGVHSSHKSSYATRAGNLYGVELVQLPPGGGQLPFPGFEAERLSFLDEWRSEETSLPVPLQLLWLEGRALPISRQQNQAGYNRFALYPGVVRCSLLLLETAWTAWPLWAPQSRDGRRACCSGGSASSVSPRSCPRPCRCGSYHARVASPCSSRRRRRGARRDLTRGRSRVLADWAVYRGSLAHCFVDGSPADRVMTSPSVRSWMVRTLY